MISRTTVLECLGLAVALAWCGRVAGADSQFDSAYSQAIAEIKDLPGIFLVLRSPQPLIIAKLGNGDATDVVIDVMKKRPVLQQSCVFQLMNATDPDLKRLEGLTELQALNLSDTPITDAGLKHLSGLANMRSLNLSDTKVTGRGLECLKAMTKLDRLDLTRTMVTDAGLNNLGNFTELESLRLWHTWLTDAGLASIGKLSKLEYLQLSSTWVTDRGVQQLNRLSKLRLLYLGATPVTDAGVFALKQALPYCQIYGSTLHPTIEWMQAGLDRPIIVSLKDGLTVQMGRRIVRLNTHEMTQIKGVQLRKSPVTDAELESLKGLVSLESLVLMSTRITDAGLMHLSGLKNLRRLDLQRTAITDRGLEQIKSLSQLQDLSLDNTSVTDLGLESLKGLKKLRRLSMTYTPVTEEGVKMLQRALPDCHIQRGSSMLLSYVPSGSSLPAIALSQTPVSATPVELRIESAAATVSAGQSYTVTLVSSVLLRQVVHWIIDWGDGSPATSTDAPSASHRYASGNRSYVVSASVLIDGRPYACSNTLNVTVLGSAKPSERR